MIQQLTGLTLRIIALSILFSFIWALIDYMRNYGSEQVVLFYPFQANYFFNLFPKLATSFGTDFLANCIMVYNNSFPGAARLGSGMGIILASFWQITTLENEKFKTRIFMTALIGIIIGARFALMISSSPSLMMLGALLGFLLFEIHLIIKAKSPRLSKLSILEL